MIYMILNNHAGPLNTGFSCKALHYGRRDSELRPEPAKQAYQRIIVVEYSVAMLVSAK